MRNKKSKFIIGLLVVVSILIVGYSVCVFSNIGFIKKWRTIYIETAMTTTSHKWLATAFIPHYIIDDVMSSAKEQNEIQKDLQSTWENVETVTKERKEDTKIVVIEESKDAKVSNSDEELTEIEKEIEKVVEPTAEELFYDKYWEVNKEDIEAYLTEHTEFNYENILIENLDEKQDIKTVFGEPIVVLDATNNVIIIKVEGEGYKGLLAKSKNSEQVTVVGADTLGTHGNIITKLANDNNAIVAINASGFADVNFQGNGGTIAGSMILDGVDYGIPKENFKIFGFKADNRMYIENYSEEVCKDYKWAIQYKPALIVDGEVYVQDSFGWGLQPRSAVGQTAKGEFLMLIVDGRQVTHSIGATVGDLAEIMMRHNCYQGMNLDGGSSSIMAYKGEVINSPSSKTKLGRYLPNAFIIKYADATQ